MQIAYGCYLFWNYGYDDGHMPHPRCHTDDEPGWRALRMRLITLLTDPHAYQDRLISVNSMGAHMERNIVFCMYISSDLRTRHSDTEFISDTRDLSSIRYFQWAASTVRDLSRSEDSQWCVWEVATALTLLILRIRWRTRAKLVQEVPY